tara:strand:- start:3787 stop:4221 length:435 start_codon:yes stop_codon:yes gene_type:complete
MLNDFLNKLSELIEEVRPQEPEEVAPEESAPPLPPSPEPVATEPAEKGSVRIILERAHYDPVHTLLVAVQERKNKIQQNAGRLALAQAEMMSQIYGLEQDAQELIADLRLKYEVPPGREWELHVPNEENPEAFFIKKEAAQEEN